MFAPEYKVCLLIAKEQPMAPSHTLEATGNTIEGLELVLLNQNEHFLTKFLIKVN